jgi:thiol-disulfide isomerase/thioredoxin
MFPIIRRFALIVAVAFAASSAFADSAADEAWNKVEEAMNNLENATATVRSLEEREAFLKSKIDPPDTAIKEFLAVAPNDPRRWQAKLFQAQNINLRGIGLPLAHRPNMKAHDLLDEIAAAPDAPVAVKGEASATKLRSVYDCMPEADWQKLAEQHLQAYPETSETKFIRGLIAWWKLRSEPLDLKFTAMDGAEVDLAKMRGKVVLIHFWTTGCGPCEDVVEAYEDLHPKGFEVIGISLDWDKAKLETFIKEKGMAWPQYFDGKNTKNKFYSYFSDRLNPCHFSGLPIKWLVDKKGMLVETDADRCSGEFHLKAKVEKLLAE